MNGADATRDPGSLSPPVASEKISLAGWLGMAAIMVVAIYAVIDRQIFILLAEQIKTDMKLSDTQLGLLQGVGLALVGVVTIYPISWLADRYDRRIVTACCVGMWSIAVVICGLAPNFAWLMVGASLVGIGEAGVTPAGYAMIPDLVPESRRQFANSLFALVSRFGGAGGVVLAGYVASAGNSIRAYLPGSLAGLHDWRLGFFVAVLFAPIAVLLVLTLPRAAGGMKNRQRPLEQLADQASSADLWAFLKANRQLQLGFFLAMGMATFGLVGVGAFVPVIAARDYGQTPVQAGQWLGAMAIITGVIGFGVAIFLTRWLSGRFGSRFHMMLLAGVCVGAAITAIPIAFTSTVTQLYLFWGIQTTILTLLSMVFPTVLQNMTPPLLRARLFALIAIFQLVAGGIGPVLVGLLSDALKGLVTQPLLAASVIIALVATSIAGLMFWRLIPSYARMVDQLSE